MSPTEKKVLQTFLDFWEVWALRKNQTATIKDIQNYFDENVTAIGSGLHEAGRDPEGVIKNFYDDFDELTAPIDLDFYYSHHVFLHKFDSGRLIWRVLKFE